MKRILVFDGEKAVKRFEMLRIALLNGGDGKGERGREVFRKEARLLEMLDTVSTLKPTDVDPEERVVTLKAKTECAQEDFELLLRYVDSAPWTPRMSRDYVDLADWLSSAEKVD